MGTATLCVAQEKARRDKALGTKNGAALTKGFMKGAFSERGSWDLRSRGTERGPITKVPIW